MSTMRICRARNEKRPTSAHPYVHKFTVVLGPTPDVNELLSIPHGQNHEHTQLCSAMRVARA